ncbi:DUF4003 family protein [Anaeromicropila herbilytica]|uniref:DUF4003 domain-containing protein n=1 Tax=Anaeromicropila herbilytica TaxID=2785025 RepID=A0A7R7EII7_9FIRM|nr:DUF4003 family protein [Anaeromicropila herbilytica]BCN29324.1 hypothetical protein bsdtb5_06190 [Anaeromicropila herbilytica]
MQASLQNRCELLVKNRDMIKSNFAWESFYIHPMCASIFTSRDILVDVPKLKQSVELIKKKTGFFSNFKGTTKLATASFLALDEEPEVKMDKVLKIHELLKEDFYSSAYLPISAMMIADMVEPDRYQQITQRTRRIYDLMKREHPFLTSSEDCTYATILALSDMEDSSALREMEKCYEILKPQFFSGNAVQSLSHVLALGEGSVEYKCNRVTELYQNLKERGYKYGTSYELATLGVLANSDIELSELTKIMIEVDEYLHTKKGFGALGVGAKQRLMYAGMLTMCDMVNEKVNNSMNTSAMNGIVSIILAQEAAICASVVAASAAASAASC